MLPGPPWTDIGEPGAVVNNDCCDVFEGVSPERHELEDTASNKLNRAMRPIAAGILIAEVTPVSLRLLVRRPSAAVSSGRLLVLGGFLRCTEKQTRSGAGLYLLKLV